MFWPAENDLDGSFKSPAALRGWQWTQWIGWQLNDWHQAVEKLPFSCDVVRLSTHQLQRWETAAAWHPWSRHRIIFSSSHQNRRHIRAEIMRPRTAARIRFQRADKHRLTLNKDILAATLILARASVFTSAVGREEKEPSSSDCHCVTDISCQDVCRRGFKQVLESTPTKIPDKC